ncbi:DMT family transporter [Ammoniphilus sp. YIM 78166]|uniref:DMT family transporter n=1 Tax=Ammoniphilus sp. YIM 78166 TaxID=1644106 RepID=UPI0010702A3E|nr:DMT family transporter [Ammoniphilus sp. YIM 78166]
MGILVAFLSAFSFASANILIKKGIKDDEGAEIGFLTCVMINTVLLGLLFLIALGVKGFVFQISWTATFIFILAGMLTTGLGRLTAFASIPILGPSRSSAIKNGSPIFTLLFALFILNETINLPSLYGIALLIAGLGLQGWYLFRQHDQSTKGVHRQWLGYALAIISALGFGVGQGVRKQGLLILDDIFYGAFMGALASLIFYLIYKALRGQLRGDKPIYDFGNRYFLAAGVMTSLGPFLFFLSASLTQVTYAGVIAGTEPVITVLLSALFLKGQEELSRTLWLTMALVIAGSAVIAMTA